MSIVPMQKMYKIDLSIEASIEASFQMHLEPKFIVQQFVHLYLSNCNRLVRV